MHDNKQIALKFMQLTWIPRKGDRVICRGKRATVDAEHHGTYLVSSHAGDFFTSKELFFVPRRHNYIDTIKKLNIVTVLETAGGIEVSRRYETNGKHFLFTFKGSAWQCLAALLDRRMADAKLNEAFNEIVFGTWRDLDRLREIQNGKTKSLPERSPLCTE